MSDEPIEAENVEYLDNGQPPRAQLYEHNVVYAGGGPPCCTGCGCLMVGLGMLLIFKLGSVVNALIMILVAAWLSAQFLRIIGVRRWSPVYAFLMVPLFLWTASVLSKLVRGDYAYTTREIVVGTLVIYIFLWLSRSLARR